MAAMEEIEDREIPSTELSTPPGSGDAALHLGAALVRWKRLLGLAVPGAWGEDYSLPEPPGSDQYVPPLVCKLVTSVWVMTVVLLLFTSIGLQWAFCRQEYYGRMLVWPGASSNSSSRDYLCVPSFVWIHLIPRLLYAFGYIAIFACIFCLHMHDAETVAARAYDVITEERQNPYITMGFIDNCHRDPHLMVFWFVVLQVFSLLSTLLGEDVLLRNLTEMKPLPHSALEWLTYSITCFVRLMVDGMIGHCLITATLSIKYLELMVERITWHLQTLVSFSSHQAASQYFFTRTQIVVHCIHGAQPHTSAAILMAALRICQIISLLTLDHVNKPRRYSSLAQLPIAIFFTMTILFYIQRNISLTETWQRSTLRDPDIVEPPETAEAPAAREQQHQLIHRISKEEERNRAVVLWYQIIRHAPPVAGKVLGMGASRGMYWAVLVVGTLYTTGYYVLIKYIPLI